MFYEIVRPHFNAKKLLYNSITGLKQSLNVVFVLFHVKSVHVSLIIGSCCEIHSPIISRNMFSVLCLPSAIVLRGNPEIRMFLNLSCQFLYLGFNGQRASIAKCSAFLTENFSLLAVLILHFEATGK